MKSVRATLLPLLSSYAVVVGGIRTLCGTVRALQWALWAAVVEVQGAFSMDPPYPTLPSTTLTYSPSFLLFVPTHLPL
jgi:hypothetical protein